MASTSDIAKRYFAALSARDLDDATACWKPGSIDRLAGHADPVTGDVRRQLEQAAEAP